MLIVLRYFNITHTLQLRVMKVLINGLMGKQKYLVFIYHRVLLNHSRVFDIKGDALASFFVNTINFDRQKS